MSDIKNETIGLSGQTALVHKQDAEGSITIDPVTGYIITEHDFRPEWAADLTLAQVAERHVFYINKLGEANYTEERQKPEVLAFEDLEWLGAREYPEGQMLDGEDHEMFTVDADAQFRMEQVAAVFGLEAELDADGNETGEFKDAQASVEISADHHRTPAEIAELERVQATGFDKAANQ